MKKLLGIIVLGLLLSGNAYAATPSLKDFKIDNTNQLYAERNDILNKGLLSLPS